MEGGTNVTACDVDVRSDRLPVVHLDAISGSVRWQHLGHGCNSTYWGVLEMTNAEYAHGLKRRPI